MAGLSLLALQPSERKRVDSNYESSVTSLLTEDSLGNIVQAFLSVDLIRPDLLLWLVHFTGYFDYYGLVRVSELSSFVIVRIDAFCGSIWHALQVHSSLLRSSHQGPRASAILSLTAFQFYRGTFFR